MTALPFPFIVADMPAPSEADLAALVRADLWASGYRPVPVLTGDKRPHGISWPDRARRDPPDAVASSPHAAALSTGILCDGLRALDLDIDHADIAAQVEQVAIELLGRAPTRWRDNSSRALLLYKAETGEPGKVSIAGTAGKIEVLGKGQQFVAIGRHPSGAELQWRSGSPIDTARDELVAVDEASIAAFFEAIAPVIGRQAQPSVPAPLPRPTAQITVRPEAGPRERAFAETALAECTTEMASTSEGGRNSRLNSLAFRMGRQIAAGRIDQGQVEDALAAASLQAGLALKETNATMRSGLLAGMQKPAEALEERDEFDPTAAAGMAERVIASSQARRQGQAGEARSRIIATAAGDLIDAETGEVMELPPARQVEAFPEELTYVPGLVGELVDWITATARRPSRVLALGAALTLVGTAMGRHMAGPTRAGTHLYVLALAPTGAGKDHVLQQIKRVLTAANMHGCIGPDEFMSMPAVINFLVRKPLALCPMDEMGAFLKRINNRRSSGFEMGITKILRTAWGTNYNPMQTPEWAGRNMEIVHAPHMSICGVSTPEEFFESLTGGDVNNGFLNRFTLLQVGDRPKEREPEHAVSIVPEAIISQMVALFGGGNPVRAISQCMSSQAEIDPLMMPWGDHHTDDGAERVYAEFVEKVQSDGDANPQAAPFFARTAEMAVRLATIRAAGRAAFKPTLNRRDMEWGRDVAMWSTAAMLKAAGLYMAETQTQADANRILRLIRDAGGRIKHRDLHQRLKNRMKSRDVKELLAGLIEGGEMESLKTVPEGGGTPTIWYVIPTAA